MYQSLIPALVVESLSMANTVVVISTKIADTKMSNVANILILIMVTPMEQEITPASPQGGMYFDGQQFYIATYSLEERNGYIDRALGLSHPK